MSDAEIVGTMQSMSGMSQANRLFTVVRTISMKVNDVCCYLGK